MAKQQIVITNSRGEDEVLAEISMDGYSNLRVVDASDVPGWQGNRFELLSTLIYTCEIDDGGPFTRKVPGDVTFRFRRIPEGEAPPEGYVVDTVVFYRLPG